MWDITANALTECFFKFLFYDYNFLEYMKKNYLDIKYSLYLILYYIQLGQTTHVCILSPWVKYDGTYIECPGVLWLANSLVMN